MSKYSRLEMIDFLNERMRPLKWHNWQMVTWGKVDKWCELLGFSSRLTPLAPDRFQRGQAGANPLQSSESAEVPPATTSGR